MTDDEIVALAPALLPYRARLEAAWAGRSPRPQVKRAALVAPDLLDIPTVAARLSCSRDHVYDLIAAGKLVRRDIGHKGPLMRVPAASVDEFIRSDQVRGVDRVH